MLSGPACGQQSCWLSSPLCRSSASCLKTVSASWGVRAWSSMKVVNVPWKAATCNYCVCPNPEHRHHLASTLLSKSKNNTYIKKSKDNVVNAFQQLGMNTNWMARIAVHIWELFVSHGYHKWQERWRKCHPVLSSHWPHPYFSSCHPCCHLASFEYARAGTTIVLVFIFFNLLFPG